VKINPATVIFFAWVAVMSSALGGAIAVCARSGVKGLKSAFLQVLGGLLMIAFVSAFIGFNEIDGYARSIPFWASLALGSIGMALFVKGMRNFR